MCKLRHEVLRLRTHRVFWKQRPLGGPGCSKATGAPAGPCLHPLSSRPTSHLDLRVTRPPVVHSGHEEALGSQGRAQRLTLCLGSGGDSPKTNPRGDLLTCVVQTWLLLGAQITTLLYVTLSDREQRNLQEATVGNQLNISVASSFRLAQIKFLFYLHYYAPLAVYLS